MDDNARYQESRTSISSIESTPIEASRYKAFGMFAQSFRSSKTFTTFVVCVAIFTDILLQNLVVPVLPYALQQRVGLFRKEEIQKWNSILLASYGGALMFGSSTLLSMHRPMIQCFGSTT